MTRQAIYTDGSYNDRTKSGGWAAVVLRNAFGQQQDTSSQEMELRAIIEAVKMADGPCTIICDHEGIVGLAQKGRSPEYLKPLWQELYVAAEGKDIGYEWKKRDGSLGQRLAHQLARDAAKGRA